MNLRQTLLALCLIFGSVSTEELTEGHITDIILIFAPLLCICVVVFVILCGICIFCCVGLLLISITGAKTVVEVVDVICKFIKEFILQSWEEIPPDDVPADFEEVEDV